MPRTWRCCTATKRRPPACRKRCCSKAPRHRHLPPVRGAPAANAAGCRAAACAAPRYAHSSFQATPVHGCAPRPTGNQATAGGALRLASLRGTRGYKAAAFSRGGAGGSRGPRRAGHGTPGRAAGTQLSGGGRPPPAILLADGYPKPRWRSGVERGASASPPTAEVTLRGQQAPPTPAASPAPPPPVIFAFPRGLRVSSSGETENGRPIALRERGRWEFRPPGEGRAEGKGLRGGLAGRWPLVGGKMAGGV